MMRSASRTTRTLPPWSAASSWTSSCSRRSSALRKSSSAAPAIRPARSSSTVAATTVPSLSSTTAASIWLEISVRWASASAVGAMGLTLTQPILRTDAAVAAAARQVLRRPRPAPRGDDRLLRAALVRAAALPDDLAALARRPARRVELPRHRAEARLPRQLDLEHRPHHPRGPAARDRPRDHRRRGAGVGVALAVQRARVGLQHRLRPAEPLVPAREAARRRADAALAGDVVRRAADRLVRLRPAEALRGLHRRQLVRRVRALGRRLAASRVRLSRRRLLPADERRAHLHGRPPGSRVRGDRARGELPGAAVVRPLLEQRDRAEGLRRAGTAARLAVRDGERDRLRRRGELALRKTPPPPGARGG